MRALILSQYYWPEPIPKPVELAEALQRLGDEVTVITGFPNYPSGQLYPGHRLRMIKTERIRGIPVIRTFEYPYHGTRALGRMLNYLSFMLSAPLGALFSRKFDVIYVWHPPLTVGVAAWVIARLRGVPFVYDVQDIWPEAAVLSGVLRPGRLVSFLSLLERFIYRRASHLIAVTDGARQNLISKGVSPARVSVMPHWFDEAIFRPEAVEARARIRAQNQWVGRFVVMFAGNVGLVQGLETVVRAAKMLATDSNVLIVVIGDGADRSRLGDLVSILGVQDRVQFVDRQPLEQMPFWMAAADCLLVHLKHSELSNYVIPTKTLAYLASAQPILMAMRGAAADLVQKSGAGVVVEPESPSALAEGIVRLSQMSDDARAAMGRAGREYLRSNLSREVVLPRYRALLAGLAEGRPET